ncbi:MAG: hypothetical protein RSA90_02845 [Lachnospiraceae bacterium]
MKQSILIVSHCFFNDSAKLRNPNSIEQAEERKQKRLFLKQQLDNGVELIQLPCPEFLLYGSNRWGHAASQFDTPYFRQAARDMLSPIVLQLEEYLTYPNRFEIIGIIGIDGSPSCGIDFTYDGDWGGDFSQNANLSHTLHTLKKEHKAGIFMDVLKEMLREKHLPIKFYSLETFPQKSPTTSCDASLVDIPIYGNTKSSNRSTSQSTQDGDGLRLL